VRTCGTCLHFTQWPDDKQGEPGDYYHGKVIGTCHAPLPPWVQLQPDEMEGCMDAATKDCQCWTGK
jgi:hypothetical protein